MEAIMLKHIGILCLLFLSLCIHAKDPFKTFLSRDSSFSIFVMKCGDEVELLDFYELYRVETAYKYDMSDGTVDERVDEFLERSRVFSEPRYRLFKVWRDYFFKEGRFLNSINFGPLKDEFDFTVQDNCEIRTLLKARAPSFTQKSVFIDNNLWSRLDEKSKAGVITNYLINLDAHFFHNIKYTVFTRYLNALLSSDHGRLLEKLHLKVSLFKKVGYSYLYNQGFFFSLKSVYSEDIPFEVDESGNITYAKFSLIPFELRKLNFSSDVKVHNVKGMRIDDFSSEYINMRSRSSFSLRSARVVSSCSGGLYIPPVPVKMNVSFINNQLHFNSLYSLRLLFHDRKIRRIYSNNEGLVIPDQEPDNLHASHMRTITECGE